MQASRSRQMNEQQADFGHIWKGGTHKAQAPPANTGHGEVMGQRFKRHGLVVERREKSIFEVLAQVLSGKCPARMTYYPKEAS